MNFLTLSDEDIAQHAKAEFGHLHNIADKDFEDCSIERFEHGYAIVHKPFTYDSSLWFLFVHEDHRRKGIGREIVRSVISKYGQTYRLSLVCDKSLRSFYSSFGFRVVERDGDLRTMMMKED